MPPSVWIEPRQNKRGRTYLLRWEVAVAGQVFRGSESCGPSKAYAEQARAKKIDELFARKLGIRPKTEQLTIAQFGVKFLAHSKKDKAASTFTNFDGPAMRRLIEFCGSLPLTMLSQDHLLGFRGKMEKDGFAPNTIRVTMRCLRSALSWAKQMNWVTETPFQQFKLLVPPKTEVARYLHEHEVEALLRNLPETARRACYLVLHTGLRRGEVIGLDWKMIHDPTEGWSEINLESHSALGIKGDFKIKTRRPRTIPIPPRARWVLGSRRNEGPVFPGITAGVLGQTYHAAKRASLGRVRFHDLRHTWATNFMWETGNIFELMRRGGWTSMESAKGYQHQRKRQEPVVYKEFPHYFPIYGGPGTAES